MNRRQRQEWINRVTDYGLICFIVSIALGSANIISADTGTDIILCIIGLCIINGIFFGDSFFGRFWDKHSKQPTKEEEYLQETISELKYGYGMSKEEVIEHLKHMYGLTDDEAITLYNKKW
jgi:hypothetical protein